MDDGLGFHFYKIGAFCLGVEHRNIFPQWQVVS